MRDLDNIRAVEQLGVDLMGFIFWDKSPRNVHDFQFPASTFQFRKVGVFVDEKLENVIARVKDCHLDYIQLHGNETPVYISSLRQHTTAKIIKAISIREADDLKRWQEYDAFDKFGSRIVDMLLFDTKCRCIGGSGEQFDWTVLGQYDGDMPFLLSGGIGPDDAERIKAFHHPKCIGIDLNSRFEDAPGLKNIDKLRNFIKSLS